MSGFNNPAYSPMLILQSDEAGQGHDLLGGRDHAASHPAAAIDWSAHGVTVDNIANAAVPKISQFGDDIAAAATVAAAQKIVIDLEGREIAHTQFLTTYLDYFKNGFIVVNNIIYPVNVWRFFKKTLVSESVSLDFNSANYDELRYSAWPQGKVWKQTYNGVRKILYNRGSEHIAPDLHVWAANVSATGLDYAPLIQTPKMPLYSGGNTSWSAGTDGVREYFITRQRASGSYLIGDTKHVLNYRTLGNTDTAGFVRKEIFLNDGTEVPVLFHSFTKLGNGRLACGAHYTSGSVGIATTASDSTVGDSWAYSEIYSAGNYVEPSVYYDAANAVTVGFLRTQSTTDKPKFFVSADNCATFTLTDLNDIPSAAYQFSPINLHMHDGKYYAFVGGRTTNTDMYLLVADAADAIANGASAFKKYYVGASKYYGSGGSGANAGDIYVDDSGVYIYYGEHQSAQREQFVDIKVLKIVNNINELVGVTSHDVSHIMPYCERDSIAAAQLGSGWSADDSGEGAAVNGGGLTVYRYGDKIRVKGALKCSDATVTIFNLPNTCEPWQSFKFPCIMDDTSVGVIFVRGIQSAGSAGEIKLINQTGAKTKVHFDFEIDLL